MMARASGRRRLSAEITSRPLPSSSRMSTTAKAGDVVSSWLRPSATDSAVVTVKPRPSMARASRCRNDLSSSTIRSERSLGIALDPASFIVVSNPRTCQPGCLALFGAVPAIWHLTRDLQLRSDSRGLKWGRRERSFKILPVPGHGDGGAVQRRRLIDQRELGPRALQKRLGDKKTEPKPKQRSFVGFRTARSRPAMGDIGRAEAIDHFGRKSRPVVTDGDADFLRRPTGGDLDPVMGEVHRVFDQIAETVADRGIARSSRFAGTVWRVSDRD